VLVLFLAASAAPTPLYRVYQARWGFSATTLTAVFAVYVVFLLITVLILGSLSDHVGRRPVIITALAADTAACILFLLAHGAGALLPDGRCREWPSAWRLPHSAPRCWTCAQPAAWRRW